MTGTIYGVPRIVNYSRSNYILYKYGYTCYFLMGVPTGTGDQTIIVTDLPVRCRSIMDVTFSSFYMNGEDASKICVAHMLINSPNIEFRTTTATTGPAGVLIYSTWLTQYLN